MATSRHHLWWPRREYKSPTQRHFRNLPCMVVEIDVETHKLIHAYNEPPIMPSHTEMTVAIERHKARECECF